MSASDGRPFSIEPGADGVYVLRGELDMASTQAVEDALAGANPSAGDLVFDLTDLTFIDSSGVLALSKAADRVRDGSLILRRPTPAVRRVLDLVGLTNAAPRIAIED